jgi:uncharacterized repeat protein (TIGR03803 family)
VKKLRIPKSLRSPLRKHGKWYSVGKTGLAESTGIVFLFCIATAIASHAQTFTTLVNFDFTDGADPYRNSMIQGADGNLWGLTEIGGAPGADGTVFKMSLAGALTTVANLNSTDGGSPQGGLVLGTDGSYYGTNTEGGTSGACSEGCGTIFKVAPNGVLTLLHSFCDLPNCPDGAIPYGGLMEATDGNFYGATGYGGGSSACYFGCGTIFKITPQGILTTLHSFDGADGSLPYAQRPLVQGADGNFFGTASQGGANADGTFFKITPAGELTILYNFCALANCADGGYPAGAIQGADGRFYGVTGSGGGFSGNGGTIFRISADGKLTTLHRFTIESGLYPDAGLIQATDGNFYGTTRNGGAGGSRCDTGGCGTVYQVTPEGELTTLHSFDSTDGTEPSGLLVQATNGSFYGMVQLGGANFDGTLFSLDMGLAPFAMTVPTSGRIGQKAMILGSNLIGTTSVTFNGTPAAFAVVSRGEISTRVPSGATTGKVVVTTPSGTLSSNLAFRVTP